MSASQYVVTGPSANDLFKSNYNKYLRWSVLMALVLTVIGAWLSPPYEPTPYVYRDPWEDDPPFIPDPDIVLPDPPKQEILHPVPIIEVAPGEFIDDVDDDWDSVGGGFWNPAPSAPPIDDYDGFVASSSNPQLVSQPKPHYPEIMRASRIEGLVMVKVLVGKTGLVEAVEVVRGIHPTLDRAAAAAAWRCKFEPGLQRSIPVRAWIEVPYRFTLRR